MQRLPLIAVLAAAFVVITVNLGGYDLWPPDEPRFGQVAREMRESGNPIALTVNGEPYKEKPPLLFWLIALASLPFGDVTETSARVPSAAAALACVYFSYRLALDLFGARAALFSGFVLTTSALFWWEARSVRTDMLLTACLSAALYFFWRHDQARTRMPVDDRVVRRYLLYFYAAVGAAVFAKGPPGIVFPLLLALAYYWGRKDGRRALRLGWGLAVVAAVIAAWLIPAYLMAAPSQHASETQSLSLGENLYRNTIGRFFLGVSKARPPWYYLENLPLNLFPWTLFLPWVIWFAWKRRRENDAMRLLLSWILPALVFFSISAGKRAVYLLPLFPALAILIGYALVVLVDSERYAWLRRTVGGVWAVLLLALGASTIFIGYFAWFDTSLYPDFGAYGPLRDTGISVTQDMLRAASIFTGAALVFSVHALVLTLRRKGRGIPFGVAGHFAGLAVVAAALVFPEVNTFKGASDFCAPLRTLSEQNVEYTLYSVAFSREEYIFYSKHPHIPYLVDDWPLDTPADMDPLDFAAQQRALGNQLRKATQTVAVSNIARVSDAEVEALRRASDSVFAFAKAKSPHVDAFKQAVGESVQAFAESVLADAAPTFLLVQEPDWRWLLPFAPRLRELTVITRETVGSERVMLLANPAAAEAAKFTVWEEEQPV